jgi:WD40 repeat protein
VLATKPFQPEHRWQTDLELTAAVFHPQADRLLTADRTGMIAVRDLVSGAIRDGWRAQNGQVMALAFLDNERVVSVGEEWPAEPGVEGPPRTIGPRAQRPPLSARVSDLATGEELLRIPELLRPADGGVFELSPDGRFLIAARDDRQLRLWELAGSSEIAPLGIGSKSGMRLAVEPTARLLFVAPGSAPGEPADSALHDLDTGSIRQRLAKHPDQVTAAAFSPDGKRLATGGRDRVIRIWEVATGHELLALPGHSGEIARLAWTRDGRRLLSIASDGTLRVWDGSP